MSYDNEQLTGELRAYKKLGYSTVFQQEYKCWNAAKPSEIYYEWKNIPFVEETTATSPADTRG